MDKLNICVTTLPEEGLHLEEPLTPDFIADLLRDAAPYAPFKAGHLDVRLTKTRDALLLGGRVLCPVEAPCSRCSEPSHLDLSWRLDVVLVPEGQAPKADEEGLISEDDAGVITYADDEVRLGEVLRDELLLNLPMQPLCRASCAGLCASCGALLNTDACRCPAEPNEGPLAQLANFRITQAD